MGQVELYCIQDAEVRSREKKNEETHTFWEGNTPVQQTTTFSSTAALLLPFTLVSRSPLRLRFIVYGADLVATGPFSCGGDGIEDRCEAKFKFDLALLKRLPDLETWFMIFQNRLDGTVDKVEVSHLPVEDPSQRKLGR